MAIFGWNRKDPPTPPASASGAGASSVEKGESEGDVKEDISFSPTKAARFFEFAQVRHDTVQFEYAMTLWLQGLRQNPASLEGLEGFFKSAGGFNSDVKAKISKDTWKQFSESGTLNKYLTSLLEWSEKPTDAPRAIRSTELAAKLGLAEPAIWLGERALKLALREEKPRKAALEALMEICERFRRFDLAVAAGEAAMRADPSDSKLGAHVRNLSAESTMSRSGFDDAGKDGGFRKNIRDLAKQQQLDAEERVVKTEETVERLVESARAEYESRPKDKPSIARYAKRLLERGREDDERKAHEILTRAYHETQEFQFKKGAGEIELRWARRSMQAAKTAAERAGAGADEQAAFESARKAFHEAELIEYEARVAAYPTDLGLKYELARRYQDLGRHEDAIALFQEAQGDIKNRGRVLFALGVSFQATNWHDEAIETFRQALEAFGLGEDSASQEVRYGLLTSLQARAVENRAAADADEAYKLASAIAMKQINFKDIRAKREELKKLIQELKQS